MVPIDVRVVDRRGNPVTDLKKEDFTVVEDGVPQEIAHFTVQTLSPDPKMAEGAPQLLVPTGDLRAQNRRVFLLLLGRGRRWLLRAGARWSWSGCLAEGAPCR